MNFEIFFINILKKIYIYIKISSLFIGFEHLDLIIKKKKLGFENEPRGTM